jgi:hypothetical protein
MVVILLYFPLSEVKLFTIYRRTSCFDLLKIKVANVSTLFLCIPVAYGLFKWVFGVQDELSYTYPRDTAKHKGFGIV